MVQGSTHEVSGQWHLHDAHDLARLHGVDPAHGLHLEEAKRRALNHGPNEIAGRASRGPLNLLLDQFKDFMIVVLLVAAVVSGVIGDLVDSLTILVIVMLNAIIGFVQAWRADRVMAALKKLAAAQASVLRSGQVQVIAASELVPGDIVLLEAGNHVPADLRLIQIAQLKVDESALTGESITVEKHTLKLTGVDHALGDQLNMAFKGTTATHGRGVGLVVATGMSTELGKVARLLDRDSERSTPLQRRLTAFGKRLALVVIAICVVIFVAGVLRGESPVLMALTSISLAVAAIPEALPAVVTVLLALGAHRMVGLNALIRRLPSVETLGSVTFICSDKTGTLTQNRMHVEWLVADGQSCSIGKAELLPVHLDLLRAAALCNDATAQKNGGWRGDPTETAMARLAAQFGLNKAELERCCPRVQELPFDAERKRMTTLHRDETGFVSYTKGAPEAIIRLCDAQWQMGQKAPLQHEALLAVAQDMASQGMRVLALAQRKFEQLPTSAELVCLETGMDLIGLIGLIDPPRPQAAAAVAACQSAGITPVMITGDHPATALAIAKRLGIVQDHSSGVLTGPDLSLIDEAGLREKVTQVRVYARVDPLQKIRIVQALQDRGEFVAMTGDGVNDAPALRQADIGVAMGRGGTDVAREAASLVLLDDNFATIVVAVREGRRIYDNIRKFVRYAMTGNSGEIWIILLAPLMGLPIPLLPIQILWVNLVTDGLPGLALAAEPHEPGVMLRPPRPPQENLFAHGLWQHVLWVGLLIAGLCLWVQAWALSTGQAHWQTMVFTVLTLSQLAHVMAIRSESESLFRLSLGSNRPLLATVVLTFGLQLATVYVPALNPIFKTEALSGSELLLCIAMSSVVFVAVELEKLWLRRQRPANG